MDDEIARLRTELGEAQARAAYAAFVAETTFSIATMQMPRSNVQQFLKSFAKGLKTGPSRFPEEAALAARIAGLFADFASRHGVKDFDN